MLFGVFFYGEIKMLNRYTCLILLILFNCSVFSKEVKNMKKEDIVSIFFEKKVVKKLNFMKKKMKL
jgi:hypothetical protein